MTISIELEAEIARLCRAEGWPLGTIAAQLGIHHDVVERVLGLQTPLADKTSPLLMDPFRGSSRIRWSCTQSYVAPVSSI